MSLSLPQKSFVENVRVSLVRYGAPQQVPGHGEGRVSEDHFSRNGQLLREAAWQSGHAAGSVE